MNLRLSAKSCNKNLNKLDALWLTVRLVGQETPNEKVKRFFPKSVR
jgi:hypothetical protein